MLVVYEIVKLLWEGNLIIVNLVHMWNRYENENVKFEISGWQICNKIWLKLMLTPHEFMYECDIGEMKDMSKEDIWWISKLENV
jgi:hypothetical protein